MLAFTASLADNIIKNCMSCYKFFYFYSFWFYLFFLHRFICVFSILIFSLLTFLHWQCAGAAAQCTLLCAFFCWLMAKTIKWLLYILVCISHVLVQLVWSSPTIQMIISSKFKLERSVKKLTNVQGAIQSLLNVDEYDTKNIIFRLIC